MAKSVAATGVTAFFQHGGIALHARQLQALLVISPQLVMLRTQKIKEIPRENAGIVPIGKAGLHGVVAHLLQSFQAHLALARLS